MASVSVGCPHCGEAEPHLTQEDIERRKEQQKIIGAYRELEQQALEEQARKEKIVNWGISQSMLQTSDSHFV